MGRYALLLLGVIALTTIVAIHPRADTQLYWYYYLYSMQGSCKAYLDSATRYPPWYPGGALIGGEWVTLSPGTHTLTLKYYIEEDRIHDEQINNKPECYVRIGTNKPDGPPGMPGFYEGEFWVISIKHPWVWNENYTTMTWNGETIRVYTKQAIIHVAEDGTITVTGNGWGTINGTSVPPITITTTSTPHPLPTITQTTTTTTAAGETQTVSVTGIGNIGEAVRSNPAAALAIGAGAVGALGIMLLALKR